MAKTQLYSVHPAVAYRLAIIDNLPETTGKSMEQWVKLLKKDGPAGAKDAIDWLIKTHKIGGTTAPLIVNQALGKHAEDVEEQAYLKAAEGYVEAMYAGPKAALRPIHDALIKLGLSMGKDIRICPCKTLVPLYRNHVIAQIKPSTRTRIDFGLALKESKKKPSKRLIDTGGLPKGHPITHRIAITSVEEIDEVVKVWLRVAYEMDG